MSYINVLLILSMICMNHDIFYIYVHVLHLNVLLLGILKYNLYHVKYVFLLLYKRYIHFCCYKLSNQLYIHCIHLLHFRRFLEGNVNNIIHYIIFFLLYIQYNHHFFHQSIHHNFYHNLYIFHYYVKTFHLDIFLYILHYVRILEISIQYNL